MAIASLVLGILAISGCLIPILGLLFAIVALIIAIIAKASKKTKGEQEGLKIAGLILSIIAFVISLLMTVGPILLTIGIINAGNDIIDDATNNLNQIATALQSQIINSYDGKTKTGPEILAAIRQYETSDSVAMIITTGDGVYYVGSGRISLPNGTTADEYIAGGIKGLNIFDGTTQTYFELSQEISMTSYYKTTVIYDANNNVIGIAVIEI